jgi:hypothetical protein
LRASALVLLLGPVALTTLASSSPGLAEPDWMSEEDMRAAFVGKPLRGYYASRAPWTATFIEGGRYEYQQETLPLAFGTWQMRGRVFCHYAGPPYSHTGCGAAKKIGENCYEFHLVEASTIDALGEGSFRPRAMWHSRGWRQDQPPTCEQHPTV